MTLSVDEVGILKLELRFESEFDLVLELKLKSVIFTWDSERLTRLVLLLTK